MIQGNSDDPCTLMSVVGESWDLAAEGRKLIATCDAMPREIGYAVGFAIPSRIQKMAVESEVAGAGSRVAALTTHDLGWTVSLDDAGFPRQDCIQQNQRQPELLEALGSHLCCMQIAIPLLA